MYYWYMYARIKLSMFFLYLALTIMPEGEVKETLLEGIDFALDEYLED